MRKKKNAKSKNKYVKKNIFSVTVTGDLVTLDLEINCH